MILFNFVTFYEGGVKKVKLIRNMVCPMAERQPLEPQDYKHLPCSECKGTGVVDRVYAVVSEEQFQQLKEAMKK